MGAMTLPRDRLPFSQGAQRRAQAQRGGGVAADGVAPGEPPGGRGAAGGRGRVGGAGGRPDVEVLQDVVVDLGRDLLALQHLLDGLVRRARADRPPLLPRRPHLQEVTTPHTG